MTLQFFPDTSCWSRFFFFIYWHARLVTVLIEDVVQKYFFKMYFIVCQLLNWHTIKDIFKYNIGLNVGFVRPLLVNANYNN